MLSGYAGVTYEIAGQFNPPLPPSANEDPGNGMLGAIAILLALLHRDRTGVGQAVENPQLNATMCHLAHIVRTVDGEIIGAGRLDPLQTGRAAFDHLYETVDGWVCVMAPTDEERRALLETLAVDAVDDDERQGDRLLAAFATLETRDVVQRLRAAGVAAVEPVGRNVHAFMNDPDSRRTGRVAEVSHPRLGNVRELDVLLRVSATEPTPHRLAPALGEHTDELLTDLGCSADEIAELRARGAVR
jgi:crotonobetainyl-CoA:carnitine CoA-transferase CaiB-like acyl-CoA transferase